jgi:hypothetical protein
MAGRTPANLGGLYNPDAYDADRMRGIQDYIGDDDPVATRTISAADALKITQAMQTNGLKADDPRFKLSLEQQILVNVTADLHRNPFVKADIERFAAKGGMYTVDNNYDAAGYHVEELDTIALVLKSGKEHNRHGEEYNIYEDAKLSTSGGTAKGVLVHELGHDQLDTNDDPNLSSFMNAFRHLSEEAWADTKEYMALKVDADPSYKPTPDEVYAEFVRQVHGRGEQHLGNYHLESARLFDGDSVNLKDYVKHFGELPGLEGNFLKGRFKSNEDLVNVLIKDKNSSMAAPYEAAVQRTRDIGLEIMPDGGVLKFTKEQLQQDIDLKRVTQLEAEDGGLLVQVANIPGENGTLPEMFMTAYRRINEGTPNEGYVQVYDMSLLHGEAGTFLDPLSGKDYKIDVTPAEPRPEVEVSVKEENLSNGRAILVDHGIEDGYNTIAKSRTIGDSVEAAWDSVAASAKSGWQSFMSWGKTEGGAAAGSGPQTGSSAGTTGSSNGPVAAGGSTQGGMSHLPSGLIQGPGAGLGPRGGMSQLFGSSARNGAPGPWAAGLHAGPSGGAVTSLSPIESLQKALGVESNGKWDNKTNDALAKVIAEVQLTPEYKKSCKEIYGRDNATPDLMPGPATIAAMKERGMNPELIKSMEALRLGDRSQSNDAYTVPENAVAVIRQAQADQTAAAALQASTTPAAGLNPNRTV